VTMAVKIRLTRKGKKHQPTYRVVVADSRSPRDGRFIEQIGRYDPRQEPSLIEIDTERASYWLANGAQPSDQVRKLLEIAGALTARPVKDSKVHVVGEEAQMAAEAEATAIEVIEDEVVEDTGEGAEDGAAPEAVEPTDPEPEASAPEQAPGDAEGSQGAADDEEEQA
jgi:small subunit ribosomal protein S16